MNSFNGVRIRKILEDSPILKADDARGTATAIVNSTAIVDKQGDLMAVGSWAKVCREQQAVAVCVNHDVGRVVGKVLRLDEWQPGDARLPMAQRAKGAGALVADLQFAMATQAGRETFELVKGGYLRQWSVQFSLSTEPKQDGQVRTIKEVDQLYECSVVLVGASPDTALLAAKGLPIPTAFADLLAYARDRGESAGLHTATEFLLEQWEAEERAMTEKYAAARQAWRDAQERENVEWIDRRKGWTVATTPTPQPKGRDRRRKVGAYPKRVDRWLIPSRSSWRPTSSPRNSCETKRWISEKRPTGKPLLRSRTHGPTHAQKSRSPIVRPWPPTFPCSASWQPRTRRRSPKPQNTSTMPW
jgi:HK97 family phage prohead protease